MVLGKLPVPGRPTILITVGQGPIALAVGAGGVVWTFLLSSVLSPLSKNPKPTNQPNPVSDNTSDKTFRAAITLL